MQQPSLEGRRRLAICRTTFPCRSTPPGERPTQFMRGSGDPETVVSSSIKPIWCSRE
jgi:hypothetical protein